MVHRVSRPAWQVTVTPDADEAPSYGVSSQAVLPMSAWTTVPVGRRRAS